MTLDDGVGSIDVDTFRIGPFASYFNEQWFVDLNMTYGYHNNDAERVSALGTTTADYDAYDISVYLGGGYQFRLDENWIFTPTASMRYSYYSSDAYSETGTGATDTAQQDTSTLHSRLGAKLTYQLKTADMLLIPELVLGSEAYRQS